MPVKITPTPDIKAPGVDVGISYAPVTIKPNPVSSFYEGIKPGLDAYQKAEASKMVDKANAQVETEGKQIFQNTLGGYKKGLESGSLTKESLNALHANAMLSLTSALTTSNVPPEKWASYQSALSKNFEQSNKYEFMKKDTIHSSVDMLSGKRTFTWNDPEEIKAGMLVNAVEGMSDAKKYLFSTLNPAEQQKMLAEEMDQNHTLESLTYKGALAKAKLDLFEADKDTRKFTGKGAYNDLQQEAYNTFDSDLSATIKLVKSGGLTADQGVASFEQNFNAWVISPDVMEALELSGRTSEEFTQSLLGLKADMTEAIKANSPEAELSVEALIAQKKASMRKDQVLLDMSEAVFGQFTTLSTLGNTVISSAMLDVLHKSVPGMGLQILKTANDSDIRTFAKLYEAYKQPDLKGESGKQTADNAAKMVGRAITNMNSGYSSEDDPKIHLENILSSYTLLLESPNYKLVDPEIKDAITKHFKIMKSNMGKLDKGYERLIRKRVEIIKETKDFYGMGQ